jgi:hypothetical protein
MESTQIKAAVKEQYGKVAKGSAVANAANHPAGVGNLFSLPNSFNAARPIPGPLKARCSNPSDQSTVAIQAAKGDWSGRTACGTLFRRLLPSDIVRRCLLRAGSDARVRTLTTLKLPDGDHDAAVRT